jgi:hypothetical protein
MNEIDTSEDDTIDINGMETLIVRRRLTKSGYRRGKGTGHKNPKL